jgi:hypothetical protein
MNESRPEKSAPSHVCAREGLVVDETVVAAAALDVGTLERASGDGAGVAETISFAVSALHAASRRVPTRVPATPSSSVRRDVIAPD